MVGLDAWTGSPVHTEPMTVKGYVIASLNDLPAHEYTPAPRISPPVVVCSRGVLSAMTFSADALCDRWSERRVVIPLFS
jgi:hypothetical protein